MEINALKTAIFNQIYGAADFPVTATGKLLSTLPPYGALLPAYIYLLPTPEPEPEQLQLATALTALTLSAFIHREVFEPRSFTVNQAVLAGDYCLALAFSFLPDSLPKTEGNEILKEFRRYNESVLTPQGDIAPYNYGALLGKIAAKATADDDGLSTEEKANYTACATAIGQLWGETDTAQGTAADFDNTFIKAQEANCGHPFTTEINVLLHAYKGVYR